jgi:pimeloyl-ACP methyl ester carboxylesterase
MPILMTHGWSGSVLEFRHIIGPLTDSVANGGRAEDAFHLVIPALPGYAFSGAPLDTGWGPARIARAWAKLMQRLGYSRWVAQGGEWGCNVTTELGALMPPGLLAIHVNTFSFDLKQEAGSEPTDEEAKSVRMQENFQKDGCGYSSIQETRPQTLGYGLADSPAGQAAWIYEKLHAWSDHRGNVEDLFSMDEMLDNIMLYWLPNAAASSAQLYWEKSDNSALHITLPVGISQFKDVSHVPKQWASRYYKHITSWNEITRGGHFAAWEQPQLLCTEIRESFRKIRVTLNEG